MTAPAHTDVTPLDVAPDEYEGPATITAAGVEIAVEVSLRSYFEPIDGHSHWIGRITANDALGGACAPGDMVTVTVGDTGAEGKLSDVDPWGRLRVTGRGPSPIPNA